MTEGRARQKHKGEKNGHDHFARHRPRGAAARRRRVLLQTSDVTRKGRSLVGADDWKRSRKIIVSGLDDQLAELKAKGISIERTTTSDYVKTATVTDPAGNRVVFAELAAQH